MLDIASGRGDIAAGLAETQTDILATDIDPDCLEHIKEYHTGLRIETLQVAGVGLEEFDDCTFRAVTIAQAIYLERDWADWLKNIVRIMQPGGKLGHRWSLGKPGDIAYDMLTKTIELTEDITGGPQEYFRGTMLKSEVDDTLTTLGMNLISEVEAKPSKEWTVGKFIDSMVDSTGVTWLIDLDTADKENVADSLRRWTEERIGSLQSTMRHYEDNSWNIWEKPNV